MSHLYLNCRSHINQLRGGHTSLGCRRYKTLSERFSTYPVHCSEEYESHTTTMEDVLSVTLCNSRPPDVTVHYGDEVLDLRETLLKRRRASLRVFENEPDNIIHDAAIPLLPLSEIADLQENAVDVQEYAVDIQDNAVDRQDNAADDQDKAVDVQDNAVDGQDNAVSYENVPEGLSDLESDENQVCFSGVATAEIINVGRNFVSELSNFENRASVEVKPEDGSGDNKDSAITQDDSVDMAVEVLVEEKENKRLEKSKHRHSSSRKHKKHQKSSDKISDDDQKTSKSDGGTKASPLSDRLKKINEERKRVEQKIREVKKKRGLIKGDKTCSKRKDAVPKLEPKTYHVEDTIFIDSDASDCQQKLCDIPENLASNILGDFESDGSSTIPYDEAETEEPPKDILIPAESPKSRLLIPTESPQKHLIQTESLENLTDSENSKEYPEAIEKKRQTLLKKSSKEAAKEKAKKIEKILEENVSKPVLHKGDLLGVLMKDMGSGKDEMKETKPEEDTRVEDTQVEDTRVVQHQDSCLQGESSLEVIDMDIDENSQSPPHYGYDNTQVTRVAPTQIGNQGFVDPFASDNTGSSYGNRHHGTKFVDPFDKDNEGAIPGRDIVNGQKIFLPNTSLPPPNISLPPPNTSLPPPNTLVPPPMLPYGPFHQEANFSTQPDGHNNIWTRLGPATPQMVPPPAQPPQPLKDWAPPLPPEPEPESAPEPDEEEPLVVGDGPRDFVVQPISEVRRKSDDNRIILDSVSKRLETMKERLPKPDDKVSINAISSTWDKPGSSYSERRSRYSPDISKHSTDKSRYSPDVSKFSTDRSRYSPEESKHSAERLRYSPDVSKYSTDRSRYSPEVPKCSTDRSRYSPKESKHSAEKSRYSPEVSKHSAKRSRYSPDVSKYSTDRSRYSPEVPKYSTDRSRYSPDVYKHSAERSRYSPEVSKYSTDRSRYSDEVSKHSAERSRYSPDVSKYSTDKSRYSPEVSEYSADRSRYSPEVSEYSVGMSRYSPDMSRYSPDLSRYSPGLSRYSHGLSRHSSNLSRHSSDLSRHSSTLSRHSSDLSRHSSELSRQSPDVSTYSPDFGVPPWLKRSGLSNESSPLESFATNENLGYREYEDMIYNRPPSPPGERQRSRERISRDKVGKKRRHSKEHKKERSKHPKRDKDDRKPKLPDPVVTKRVTESGYRLLRIDQDTPLVPDTTSARSAEIEKPLNTMASFVNLLSSGPPSTQRSNVVHTLSQLVANHTKKNSPATEQRPAKSNKPDPGEKFHTRTLLKGKGVKPRYIPLDPVYKDHPFNSRGEPVFPPSDPRVRFYGKKKKTQDYEEERFVDSLL